MEKNSQQIEDFLSNFRKDTSTVRGYRCHLNQYFEVIDKNPDNNYIKDPRIMENGEKIQYLDGLEKDIKKYWKYLINNNYTPKTVSNAVNCIKVFLKQYRIRLDDIFWEELRKRGTGSKPITLDKAVTKEILREILEHGTAKHRAVFLVWSSSGMREDELVQITPNDIEWNSNPVKINVRHVGKPDQNIKTKYSRYCFITPEATHALKEWLKILGTNPDRIFPWHSRNIRKMWNRLLVKAEYDDERDDRTIGKISPKGRRIYHANTVRKFFRTRLGRYDRDLTDFLMGHKHYLTENYLRMSEEEVAKLYREGMQHLMIYETSVDTERVDSLENQLKEKDKQLDEMQNAMEKMKAQIMELRLEKLEEKTEL